MNGVIFRETLRRNWRMPLYLGGTMAVFAAYIVLAFNDSAVLKQYGEILDSMKWATALFGGTDAAFISTPTGFLNFGFYTWTVLILAGYGVIVGLNITANEEERGIMDVQLSAPVERWKLVLEKLLAHGVLIILSVAIGVGVLLVVVNMSAMYQEVDRGALLQGAINMLPITFLSMTMTAFIATLVRRRNTAATLAAVILVASYLVDFIGGTAQSLEGLRSLSIFRYYDSVSVIKNGLVWGNWLGLTAVMLVLGAGAMYFFQRREVGV